MFASRTNWRLEPNRLARAQGNQRRSGRKLLDLTASNPTTCGFDYPEKEILSALADAGALKYAPESKGLLSARRAVAAYYGGRPGFGICAGSVDPERIILTAGTSEAYSYVLRLLCEPGDEILCPAPSYPLLEYVAGLNDVRIAAYPLVYDHGWQIDFAALRAAITPKSRAVLLVHPNNPAGCYVKPKEAAELREICAEHEMAVVADEVFLDYTEGGKPHSTFALDGPALTFTLSGLSKISALPQMKLAWMTVGGPSSLVDAAMERLDIIADTYLSPGTPVQIAAARLLGIREMMQRQLRERIAANLARLDATLEHGAAITRLVREGGWYAVLRVPGAGNDEDLAADLLEQQSVLAHPGRFFDFPAGSFLIVSLITPEAEFAEGVARLLEFFRVSAS
jgi:alanine-synthesizing transaminase